MLQPGAFLSSIMRKVINHKKSIGSRSVKCGRAHALKVESKCWLMTWRSIEKPSIER